MSTDTQSPSEREDIEMLLPWYENGTLSDADMRRVEAALASDPVLGERLALIREERAAAVEANEMAGAPSRGALDRLMASIEAESGPARESASAPGWLSRLFGAPIPANFQWVGAAAAVVIVLQAAALGYFVTSGVYDGARYETASAPAEQADRGTFALVRFSEEATAAAIADYLSEMDMEIVSGPKPGGVFTIRLSEAELSAEDRDALLKKMLSNQMLISFAVPADGSNN